MDLVDGDHGNNDDVDDGHDNDNEVNDGDHNDDDGDDGHDNDNKVDDGDDHDNGYNTNNLTFVEGFLCEPGVSWINDLHLSPNAAAPSVTDPLRANSTALQNTPVWKLPLFITRTFEPVKKFQIFCHSGSFKGGKIRELKVENTNWGKTFVYSFSIILIHNFY